MITYTDKFGNPVTEGQIALLKEYNINTFYDKTGLLKIKESIKLKKGEIVSKLFEYYIDSKEDKENIIKLYTSKRNDCRLIIYSGLETALEYKMWDCEIYSNNGTLVSKNKVVYDNRNRWILNLSLDMETNEIKNNPLPLKRYYGIPGLTLEFTYRRNDNNEYTVQVKDIKSTESWSQSEFIKEFGLDFWDEHPYYHSLHPFLPSSSEI